MALNCAAVPATLIESELFGYEKGAFTGAVARKHGHIEHAHGGTLFLDEIGDMPIDLQGKLLRVLQEGEILRVGGRQPIKVDVRVVAATNVRLREAIAAGKLARGSLLPPERADHSSAAAARARRRCRGAGDLFPARDRAASCSASCTASRRRRWRRCSAYPWPGNVRELIATIRRAVVLANGPLIETADLRLEPAPVWLRLRSRSSSPQPRRQQASRRPARGSGAERDAILQAIEESRFNMTRAARSLGVSRATLYRMLQRNRIELAQQYRVRGCRAGCGED